MQGTWFEEERVFKIVFPRTDVQVTVDHWPLPPFMGLSTWVSFISIDGSLMVMGDLVLFEDEVNPVMKMALTNGLSITALHHHFFFDHPKVYFMHIHGTGDPEMLSIALKRSFDQIKSIRAKDPPSRRRLHGKGDPSQKFDQQRGRAKYPRSRVSGAGGNGQGGHRKNGSNGYTGRQREWEPVAGLPLEGRTTRPS